MTNTSSVQVLTVAGEQLLAKLNAEEKTLVIDKYIFADVPDRPAFPQREDVIPTEYVVHEADIDQKGRLTANSVIYSATLASSMGPFHFNWSGLYCSEHDVLVTVHYPRRTEKTANQPGLPGNTLVRSQVLQYTGVADITDIIVDASSWQYDAAARMSKMDNDTAQAIIDQNGKDWFIEDGFVVTPQSTAFNIKAGAGYVSGNRIQMDFDRTVQVSDKPSFIYIDAWREGSPVGEWLTKFNFVVSAEEKDDYTDGQGVKHFVCTLCQVLADGSVSDVRPEGESADKAWVSRNHQRVIDNVSVLRNMSGLSDGQSIHLQGYHSNSANGGGELIVKRNVDDVDDGGSVFVTTDGARLCRPESIEYVPEHFGADGSYERDREAIQRLFDSVLSKKLKLGKALGRYRLSNPQKSSDGYSTWMAFNSFLTLRGLRETVDWSSATFEIEASPDKPFRGTAIDFIDCQGEFKAPYVNGQSGMSLAVDIYVDDSAFRIGALCRDFTIYTWRGVYDYLGHGVLVRNYAHDIHGVTENGGVPESCHVKTRHIYGCWQSGICLVNGRDIHLSEYNVKYSGRVKNKNAQQATVGHGVHFEPVYTPDADVLLESVWLIDGYSEYNRESGLHAHTLIKDLTIRSNKFRRNEKMGANYEAYCHGLVSDGNEYSYNGDKGVQFNCGTLTTDDWATNQHAARFDDRIEHNDTLGFYDASGSASLRLSGFIGRNLGGGAVMSKALGSQSLLVNLDIFDNGEGAQNHVYGLVPKNSILSNVKVTNTDNQRFNQKAFKFDDICKMSNVEAIGHDDDYDFDATSDLAQYLPICDSNVSLSGDIAKINNGCLWVKARPIGNWILPSGYRKISIASEAGFYPDFTLQPASRGNLGLSFILVYRSGSIVKLKVSTGTINGGSNITLTSGDVYQVDYDSESNITAIKV